MTKPTIIKGPLPGQAVEAYRNRHGGALPGELLPCPHCGFDESSYGREKHLHIVTCLHCGSRSPATATEAGALTVWNARSMQPGVTTSPVAAPAPNLAQMYPPEGYAAPQENKATLSQEGVAGEALAGAAPNAADRHEVEADHGNSNAEADRQDAEYCRQRCLRYRNDTEKK